MRVALLTREYPPEIYGGAGVHVDFLSRGLRELVDLSVHCWGQDRSGVVAHRPAAELEAANAAVRTLSVDLSMVASLAAPQPPDLVHTHTWYANLAGHLAALQYDIPHVMTAHSLEPSRPWKREQLGGGYAVSSWVERTAIEAANAVVAVSHGMRTDILRSYPNVAPDRVHVVHNGIDTELYRPVEDRDVWGRHGIDPTVPTVLFLGRVTRQKGFAHLLRAARDFDPDAQLVLCAGEADTPELGREIEALAEQLRQRRKRGVFWIPEMLPRPDAIQLLSGATVFVCPSVYEPLGIVNLEAMACGTAVVASAVGGIPEVVDDGVTGLLVPYEENAPADFEAGLARRVNEVLADPALATAMGVAGRQRAAEAFGWDRIARETVAVYEKAGE